jgi:hypothetical protein
MVRRSPRRRRARLDPQHVLARTEILQRHVRDHVAAAQRLFRGRDPIGRQLSVAGAPRDSEGNARWQTVVGVVSDSHLRGISDVRLDVYMPHQQVTQRVNAIVLRTAADAAAPAATVRAAILAVDSRAVIGRVQTLEAIVGTATAP